MTKFVITQLTNRGDAFETEAEALAAAKVKANDPKANGAVFYVVDEERIIRADEPAQG